MVPKIYFSVLILLVKNSKLKSGNYCCSLGDLNPLLPYNTSPHQLLLIWILLAYVISVLYHSLIWYKDSGAISHNTDFTHTAMAGCRNIHFQKIFKCYQHKFISMLLNWCGNCSNKWHLQESYFTDHIMYSVTLVCIFYFMHNVDYTNCYQQARHSCSKIIGCVKIVAKGMSYRKC
jgi:hypothetical protein